MKNTRNCFSKLLVTLFISFTGIAQNIDFKGMHSDAPAKKWQDALIGGNGEMGVLVFGDPSKEQIIFNHEFCYEFVGTEELEPPDIAKYLPEVQRLMLEGKYDEATKYSYKMAKKEGYPGLQWTDPYHPAAVMHMDQKFKGETKDYKRSVNFENGEIAVSWTAGSENYLRQTFVSLPDKIVVQKFTGSGNLNVIFDMGQLVPKNIRQQSKYGKTLQLKPGKNSVEGVWMIYRQPYKINNRGYEVVTKIVTKGGESKNIENKVVVTDAKEILVFTRIVFLEDYKKSEIEKTKNDINALKANYDALLQKHADIHGEMFNRVQLDLFAGKEYDKSSEDLIASQDANIKQINLGLLQKMFDMGRYALISSSGKNPPNLMGIWNGAWRPEWSGDFTTDANINLQIASAAIGDLPEAIDSYMTMLERIMDDWEINAQKLYGVNGYLAGTRTSGRRNLHTHFNISFPGEYWLAGAEWLLLPCYDYYLVSGDEQFLKERLLPAMKKTVQFFDEFLTKKDTNGNYVFVPSYSPENSPANIKLQGSINATMDIAAAKEAIQNLIFISKKFDIEKENIPKWEALLSELPPYLINKDGALKEWAIANLEDHYDHRHISHLYPLWPGFEINPEETPEMFEAARIAFEKKGRGNNSAHGLMHSALIASRLKEGEKVYNNLLFMLTNGYLFTSLFTSHNPNHHIYNADALNSLPAAMLEMLVYSRPGVIELLPACSEQFIKGKITGVKCRTQATVDQLEWDFKKGEVKAIISSDIDQEVELFFRRKIKSIKDVTGKEYPKTSKSSRKVKLTKDNPITVVINF